MIYRPRLVIISLIALLLAAFCLTAAAKLTATPKFDRIQIGMRREEVEKVLGGSCEHSRDAKVCNARYVTAEGEICVVFHGDWERASVTDKRIRRRGPLDRLAWLLDSKPKPMMPPGK